MTDKQNEIGISFSLPIIPLKNESIFQFNLYCFCMENENLALVQLKFCFKCSNLN